MLSVEEQQELSDRIDEMFENRDEPLEESEVVDELMEEFECNRGDVEKAISRKIQNAMLFEPSPGELKRVMIDG